MPPAFARHTALPKSQSSNPTKPSRANPAQTLDSGHDFSAASAFVQDFSRTPARTRTPFLIQPKLTINTPGDEYEQEADRISERVMRMPEPPLPSASANNYTAQQKEPHAQKHLRTKRVEPTTGEPIAAPPIVQEVLSSPGQPLDAGARAFMEPRFGHDFSQVRVHADERSAEAASSVNARAFTAGDRVVFGAGEYAPQTEPGRRLLSHELAHTLQQRSGLLQGARVASHHAHGAASGSAQIQRKLVDQKDNEIRVNLDKVKPGDTVTPEFHDKASSRVKKDTTKIVNAMLKTPSGLSSLQTWIALPGSIRLWYHRGAPLLDDEGEEAHGFSVGSDPNLATGKTEVNVSGAGVRDEKDRYRELEGEQWWGAVAVHEAVHQSKENLLIKGQYDALRDEINANANTNKKKDPREAKLKTLAEQKEEGPIRAELISLIEYDVLYPDQAGKWLTRNFEKKLGKSIYKETVESAVNGLVIGGYIFAEQKSKIIDVYLTHHKRSPKKN